MHSHICNVPHPSCHDDRFAQPNRNRTCTRLTRSAVDSLSHAQVSYYRLPGSPMEGKEPPKLMHSCFMVCIGKLHDSLEATNVDRQTTFQRVLNFQTGTRTCLYHTLSYIDSPHHSKVLRIRIYTSPQGYTNMCSHVLGPHIPLRTQRSGQHILWTGPRHVPSSFPVQSRKVSQHIS